MRAIQTIAAREFRQVIGTRAFALTTLVGLLVLIAISFIPTAMNYFERRDLIKIAVTDAIGGQYELLENSLLSIPEENRPNVQLIEVVGEESDPAVLEARVQDGSYTGYVSLTAEPNRSEPVFTLVAKRVYPSLISSLELILRPIALQYRLADLRISPEELNQLNAPTLTQVISLAEKQQDMEAVFASQILAYLMLFLLYMTLIGYGSVLTNGVAAEKGSRVMEMMLVSARPTDLLLGKMIGLGLASFLQYLVWITVGIGVTWLTGAFTSLSIGSLPFELASVPLSTALYFLLFYLLGYFSYAGIFAAAGCLVNRPEESSQTVMPATFVLMVAFFLAYSGLMSPESTVARVSSLLPLVAPMAMFTRIVMTTVPWYEIVLSIVITIGFIQLSIMAGGRIYRAGVLSARRISWMEGLRGSR